MTKTFLSCSMTVAYFSMEIGIDSKIPTYSGGLGILAGDTLKAAADLGMTMVAVTLLYRKGYFRQHLDAYGNQTESPFIWSPEKHLERLPQKVSITLENRQVHLGVWRYLIKGITGHTVPLYFLDTALPENNEWDQSLSDSLYGGDNHFRMCQEVVLGMGGVAILKALGHRDVQIYHMNEGHSAFLTLALLEQTLNGRKIGEASVEDKEAVRQKCVFTTHTPVPAGHDQFSGDLVTQVLGEEWALFLKNSHCCLDGVLNMTYLALSFSRYINGVAMRHGEISQSLFPHYPIDSITNGVHAVTWASPPFAALFDCHIPDWRHDNFYLRHAVSIPLEQIRKAHHEAKKTLIEEIEKREAYSLNPDLLTLGFARRATTYKRPELLFWNRERLKEIVQKQGPLQIIYAGKAHPHDETGKKLIREIFKAQADLHDTIKIVYLEEYDMNLGRILCAGVDLWLNTPKKPQEASGTSGMKAAINGVPSLSVLDGWWIEGHVEGVTGWAIGGHWEDEDHHLQEAESLYEKLEKIVLPLYYSKPDEFDQLRQSTIAINGSFFNAQRMVLQYLKNAYLEKL